MTVQDRAVQDRIDDWERIARHRWAVAMEVLGRRNTAPPPRPIQYTVHEAHVYATKHTTDPYARDLILFLIGELKKRPKRFEPIRSIEELNAIEAQLDRADEPDMDWFIDERPRGVSGG